MESSSSMRCTAAESCGGRAATSTAASSAAATATATASLCGRPPETATAVSVFARARGGASLGSPPTALRYPRAHHRRFPPRACAQGSGRTAGGTAGGGWCAPAATRCTRYPLRVGDRHWVGAAGCGRLESWIRVVCAVEIIVPVSADALRV